MSRGFAASISSPFILIYLSWSGIGAESVDYYTYLENGCEPGAMLDLAFVWDESEEEFKVLNEAQKETCRAKRRLAIFLFMLIILASLLPMIGLCCCVVFVSYMRFSAMDRQDENAPSAAQNVASQRQGIEF
ncbi:MAG: hypothetical protein MHMPM18_001325 [Marteilia pararefringens]